MQRATRLVSWQHFCTKLRKHVKDISIGCFGIHCKSVINLVNMETIVPKKVILIDGHHHLVGRVAAMVAKLALSGKFISVVRCEDMNFSGSFYRNRLKYMDRLHKRCNVNPIHGPLHYRSPSSIFLRAVRGMLPIKTTRGRIAFKRIQAYEGVPKAYQKMKKMMIPEALRILQLRAGRKYCDVGRLAHSVGWKYQNVVSAIENTRKAKGKSFAKQKKREADLLANAKKVASKRDCKLIKINRQLAVHGY